MSKNALLSVVEARDELGLKTTAHVYRLSQSERIDANGKVDGGPPLVRVSTVGDAFGICARSVAARKKWAVGRVSK